ncbi:hypothetical protein [Fulvivirga lutea]|uniref:Uncharacterized protein n=1 Tax=Fulvivirga lutea TaxID=2810512 RepID=A0A974WL26_9BACT|nr:hypothetical protein [Fulvivirga lutea]QSE99187.1 hypothetical protein JR347_08890 [Fulvivirga lutea]
MIDSKNNDDLLIKGINHGYILANENPNYLKDLLLSLRSKNDYSYGLRKGRKLYMELNGKKGLSI